MSSYTRCPHCDTAFVVREEHLQIADGNVRCGSCKSVFNAREFLMELPFNKEPDAEEQAEEQQIPVLEESTLEQNYEDPEAIQAFGEAKVDSVSSDHLNEEKIIPLENEIFSPATDVDVKEHSEDVDYVQIDLKVEASLEQSTEVELPEGAIMEIKDDSDLFAESLDNLQLSETDPESRESVVDNFTKPEQKPSKILQKLLWSLGGLLLVIITISSIFWIKRLELAKDDNWRPTLDKICQYVECGIPPRRDISKIQLQNREVSSGQGTMTVNMLLVNMAVFEQEYPRIEMSFSDLDGNALATHLVLPAEYLRTELIGSLMPRNVPVHIEFKLDVDTSVAVGYEFKFL